MAEEDIRNLLVDNVNGLVTEGIAFWRTRRLSAPHNAMTSMSRIRDMIESERYRDISNVQVFNYSAREIFLESGNTAHSISIRYSHIHSTSYEFDTQNGVFRRYMRGRAHVDSESNEQYTAKNIIIKFVQNSDLNDPREMPNSEYQRLETVGQGRRIFHYKW